jgi:hypothetical protein
MSKLSDMLKKFAKKETVKEKRDDSFTADAGRWEYTVKTIIPKSKLVDYFYLMKRKVKVKEEYNDVVKDVFELDANTRKTMEKKIINDICTFNEIVAQVKQDLPRFRVLSQEVALMRFESIDNFTYRVEISLKGACEGD